VWAAFRITRRESSERFSYGYHRVEDLAGLAVVALIAAGAGLVMFESIRSFGSDIDANRPWLVFVAGFVGFAGNEAVAQFKIRTGKRIHSAALVADGLHSRTDGLTSLGVVAAAVGLILGAGWLDASIGLGIGVIIAWTAWESGRVVMLRLLDQADPELRAKLESIAGKFGGIDHVNELRLRQLGRTVHVVANVCLPAEYPLGKAHDAMEELRGRWLAILPPGSVVDIHPDPFTREEGSAHAAHAPLSPR
jgi:cation diffusion facilitator family transporter